MSAAQPADVAWADTNLFIALFADASHALHERALNLFRRVSEGSLRLIVTPMVIAEVVYVAESLFEWRRATVATQIAQLLTADGLDVREAPVLVRALELYGASRKLDFVDAYLAGCALIDGPQAIASLDRDFDRVAGIRRLSST